MIRKARVEDAVRLSELYRILFKGMADLEPHYMKEASQDSAFIDSIINEENDFTVFVAEDDGQIQGFAIAQLQNSPPYNAFVQERCVYLMDVVVNPTTRGKGFGKALIQRVKEWGIEHQVHYFELSVLTQNQKAIALYEREGLRPFSQSMRMRLKE